MKNRTKRARILISFSICTLVLALAAALSAFAAPTAAQSPGQSSSTANAGDQVVTFPDPNLEQAIRTALSKPTGDIYRSELETLTSLTAANMGITDLSGIQYCANLQEAWLYMNSISDVSPLASLTKLEGLWLYMNKITNITPLAGLTNLTGIYLCYNQIGDISILPALSKLQVLYISYNQIDGLSTLQNLTALNMVNLEGNKISDIAPLVSNPGIGAGDTIKLANNYLDISAGAQDLADIHTLISRGANVTYQPQNAVSYTLTLNIVGSGSVSKSPDQAAYSSGAVVTVTASPASGWTFSGWSGDLSGSANPASVTMNSNKAITATFIQAPTPRPPTPGPMPTPQPPAPAPPKPPSTPSGGGIADLTTISTLPYVDGKLEKDTVAMSLDGFLSVRLAGGISAMRPDGSLVSYIAIRPAVAEFPPCPEGMRAICQGYELNPTGVTFSEPVVLTFKYGSFRLPANVSEKNMVIAAWDPEDKEWTEMESTVDPDANTIQARISHLSMYSVMVGTRPADLEINNLSVSPSEIRTGETCAVTATVGNGGDLTGKYKAVLRLDNHIRGIQTISVAGKSEEAVEFSLTGEGMGEYMVDLGGLQAALNILPSPASFEIGPLKISPAAAAPGEEVSITANVVNKGESEGTYQSILRIDGSLMETRDITLRGGASEEVAFTVTTDTPGDKTVDLDGLTGSFSIIGVQQPEEPGQPQEFTEETAGKSDTWMLALVIAAFVLSALALMIWRPWKKARGSE